MKLGWAGRLGAVLIWLWAAGWLGGGAPAGRSSAGLTPVCALQGSGSSSPLVNKAVTTRGVVTFDLDQTSRKGFFIQAADCDGDPASSDAIFVYLGESVDAAGQGQLVEVSGTVREIFGRTELAAAPAAVSLLAEGQPLPAALELIPPFDPLLALVYLEAREGMLVGMGRGLVLGPTGANGETWIANTQAGVERAFWDDPRGFGELIPLDDGGLYALEPAGRVGDEVLGLQAVLDYRLGRFSLLPAAQPVVLQSLAAPALPPVQAGPGLSLATFNLAGLFDTWDDPLAADEVLSAEEYQRRLQKRALAIRDWLGAPDLLAAQEVENRAVVEALLSRPELGAAYEAAWFESPDPRGLDLALLYRRARMTLLEAKTFQGCTDLVDGLGPDGNGDVINPVNTITCDLDGDGNPDGNRLFSRPPLAARLYTERGSLWVVGVHFKSKVEDAPGLAHTLPRRLEQARFTAGLAQGLRRGYQGDVLFVLGDLNDDPDSQTLEILRAVGLENRFLGLPADERYSYVFQGVSYLLDGIMADLRPGMGLGAVYAAHVNSDYPAVFGGVLEVAYRSSDHDPLLAHFLRLDYRLYLPLMAGGGGR